MSRMLVLRLAVLVAAGALGFWFSSILISSGDVDLEENFVRPKNQSTPEYRQLSIEEVQGFGDFSLYWLGDEFQGLPLTRIIRQYAPQTKYPEDYLVFIYGTCTPSADAGCMPPLQIRIEPYCYTQPGLFADEAKDGPVFKVRGADAQRISEGLQTWVGNVGVKIDGYPPDLLDQAAEALVAANGGGPAAAGQPFPRLNTDCSDYTLEPYGEAAR